MKQTLLLSIICLFALPLLAQQPASRSIANAATKNIDMLLLPTQDNAALLQAELAQRSPGRAPQFAAPVSVDVSPKRAGTWTLPNEQDAVWQLKISSPGAYSLNLGFDQFYMPEGAELYIHALKEAQILGPFTPADNEDHSELWTPIVPGDELILELRVPQAVADDVLLHLKVVNHDFLNFGEVSALSGSCNLDVICGAADGWGIVDRYRDIIQSVAVYSFGGSTFCTGFLVNSVRQDCTPYFVTANHCGINANNAPSLVVYWNYINSFCRQPNSGASGQTGNGTLTDFNSGAVHLASYSPSDVTLVQLDDEISETANAWFAGWDASQNLAQDTVIAIHHPSTDEKRISFQFDGVYRGTWGGGDTPSSTGNHLIIEDWEIGTTEGGSSGSPLFDNAKRVIGQLHGGQASCGNQEYDSYGWWASSWIGGGTSSSSLKPWLDPDNTGILTIDGRSQTRCGFNVAVSPEQQSICAPANLTFDLEISSNFTNAVSLTVEDVPAGMNITFSDNMVAPGASAQMNVQLTGAVMPGNYTLTLAANDGENDSTSPFTLEVYNGVPTVVNLTSPANGALDQIPNAILNWATSANAETYTVQIATDAGFANILQNIQGLTTVSAVADLPQGQQTYYWRVRAVNECGTGPWSQTFNFEVAEQACSLRAAQDLPITISDGPANEVSSSINVTQNGTVAEIIVRGLLINHDYVGDLVGYLTSPSGTEIQLFASPGGGSCARNNLLVSFLDDATLTATDFTNTCNAGAYAVSGDYQPLEGLSNFIGEPAAGQWTLRIADQASQDGGALTMWSLEICLVTSSVSISTSTEQVELCIGDPASATVSVGTGFVGPVTLSASGLPNGATATFTPNPAQPGDDVTVTFSNVNALGNVAVTINAQDDTNNASTTVNLLVVGAPATSTLTSPANNVGFIGPPTISFSWSAVAGASSYVLEIATDENFESIISSTSYTNTAGSFTPPAEDIVYWWRVRTRNECGESVSLFRSFFVNTAGVNDLSTEPLEVWPNPTQQTLFLRLPQAGSNLYNLQLYNINGQQLQTWDLPAQITPQHISLAGLPDGTYTLRILGDGVQWVQRVVKVSR